MRFVTAGVIAALLASTHAAAGPYVTEPSGVRWSDVGGIRWTDVGGIRWTDVGGIRWNDVGGIRWTDVGGTLGTGSPALHWSDPRSGRYAAQQTFTPPGSPPVSFARGWATIEGKYRGERFRFANTHLEVASFPAVQEAQAREFLAGPAASDDAVIAVGDFNTAADGSSTGSYDLLTGVLTDAWRVNPGDPGFTSGQNGTLSNPTSLLDQRIDLVLTRSSARTQVRALEAHVVGDTPFQQVIPRWPSDHAGVVATLALR